MYKVGDKVRVTKFYNNEDIRILELGKKYTVAGFRKMDGAVLIKVGIKKHPMVDWQIEKVEEIENMTFPEMAQKLIDGEFEVGAELVMTIEAEITEKWHVTKSIYGYGINKVKGEFLNNSLSTPSNINATWTVKEQPIKEMSIEQLQKELGYKLKIVEYSNQGVE